MAALPPLLVSGLLIVLPACGGTTANIGGMGGAAGTGAAGNTSGEAGVNGAAGAGGTMVDAGVCTPPSIAVAGNELIFVDVEWCGSALSCATCTWEFLSSGGGGLTTPTSVPCKLPELTCPGLSIGTGDAGLTSCTAPPNAAGIDGALVQLVVGPHFDDTESLSVPPLGCFAPGYGAEQSDGSAPTINGAPCLLGGFTCVPACSACP
jgi:hypothetical protein